MPPDIAEARSPAAQSRYRTEKTIDFNNISSDLPKPNKTKKRKECDKSLAVFLKTCFPRVFKLDWSPDHIRLLNEIQDKIVNGGLKSIAYPRGSGKTAIMLHAGMWAILSGHRKYICIVTADETSSTSNLSTIRTQIAHSSELGKYYGREIHCLKKLGNESRRATGQHVDGAHTRPILTPRMVGFGHLGDSKADGAVITTCGITGRIRGQQHTTLDGSTIRPDFLIVDDPQNAESAVSPSQIQKRLEILNGDCLGMAGPGVKISGFCTCTVIAKDDLASRLLDRQESPDWNADKVAMITKWPKHMAMWDEYNEIRIDEIELGSSRAKSKKFYRDNRKKMDEGAEVYWEQRKSRSDISGLQHAMDLYYRDQQSFFSEYQNAPMETNGGAPWDLSVNRISRRVKGLARGVVPNSVDKLVAFVDTQLELFYYAIVAFTNEGRAYVVDYGSCPDQGRHHWAKTDIKNSLQSDFGEEFEVCIRSGLTWLTTAILENSYQTEDGAEIFVDKLAIDARWGESTEIIRQWVRESPHRSKIHPSMGQYVGANSKAWQKLGTTPREKDGLRVALVTPKKAQKGARREMYFDSNYWKSFLADRLTVNLESDKSLVLFNAPAHVHRMLAEHCCAEEPFRVIAKSGKEVIEWKEKRNHSENDFFDCLVGACALASIAGAETHAGNKKLVGGRKGALDKILKRKKDGQFFKSR